MTEFLNTVLWPSLVAILGGCNIVQLVTIREERKKASYDAENTHIDGLKAIIELQAAEIQRLQERIEKLERKAYGDDEEFA